MSYPRPPNPPIFADDIVKRGMLNALSRMNCDVLSTKISVRFTCDFGSQNDPTAKIYRDLLELLEITISNEAKIVGKQTDGCSLNLNSGTKDAKTSFSKKSYTITIEPELYFDLCNKLGFNPKSKLPAELYNRFKEQFPEKSTQRGVS